MHAMFILGYPIPFPGAAWRRIAAFAKHWAMKGHMIDVCGVFTIRSRTKCGYSAVGNFRVYNHILSLNIRHPLIFCINWLISCLTFTLVLLIKSPRVVIVSVPTGAVGLGAMAACTITRTKYVVDYRDEWEDYLNLSTESGMGKRFYSFVKRTACHFYRRSMFVTAVTSSYVESLRARGIHELRLLPNGADIDTFRPGEQFRNQPPFRMVYVGGVGGYYRLDLVLRAMRQVIHQGFEDIELIIASRSEMQETIDLARQLGLLEHLTIKGAVNDPDTLCKIINESDVGLIPYDDCPLWRNSVPAKFFEYCACGIPVLATTLGSSVLGELITQNQIGLIVPPLDAEEFAKAIIFLFDNPEYIRSARTHARTLIVSRFSRRHISQEFLNMVETIASSK